MNPLKLLYIGAGAAGEPIINRSMQILNQISGLESEVYIVGGKSNPLDIYKDIAENSPELEKINIKTYNSETIHTLFGSEKQTKFDFIVISAGDRKKEAIKKDIKEGVDVKENKKILERREFLEDKITSALEKSGFDVKDKKSPHYRLRDELPKNWDMISHYAKMFADSKVEGLVDIFTNQPDFLAYFWASITGNVKTVMGNNHIDTFRMRRHSPIIYQDMSNAGKLNKKRIKKHPDSLLPFFTAICGGLHGGGCAPSLKGYKIGKSTPSSEIYEYNVKAFYEEVKKDVINHTLRLQNNKDKLRWGVFNAYHDVIYELLTNRLSLGMSIFQKITGNPCFDEYFERNIGSNPDLKKLKEEDRGLFIGWGTRINSVKDRLYRSFFWEMENPPYDMMEVWTQDDFVSEYIKSNKFIDLLIKEGLIPNRIDISSTEEEKYSDSVERLPPLVSEEVTRRLFVPKYVKNGESAENRSRDVSETTTVLVKPKTGSEIKDKFLFFAPSIEDRDNINIYQINIPEDIGSIDDVIEPVEQIHIPNTIFLHSDGKKLYAVSEKIVTPQLNIVDLATKEFINLSDKYPNLKYYSFSSLKELEGRIFLPCKDDSSIGALMIDPANKKVIVELKTKEPVEINSISVYRRKNKYKINGLSYESIHVWAADTEATKIIYEHHPLKTKGSARNILSILTNYCNHFFIDKTGLNGEGVYWWNDGNVRDLKPRLVTDSVDGLFDIHCIANGINPQFLIYFQSSNDAKEKYFLEKVSYNSTDLLNQRRGNPDGPIVTSDTPFRFIDYFPGYTLAVSMDKIHLISENQKGKKQFKLVDGYLFDCKSAVKVK